MGDCQPCLAPVLSIGRAFMKNLIHCPQCGFELEVSAVLREQLEAEMRESLQAEVETRVRALAVTARERYSREAEDRVRLKDDELADARGKLAAARAKEFELLKKHRELAEREAERDLEVELKVADELRRMRGQEAAAAQQRSDLEAARQRLRDEEHRQQIEGMQKHIEELQRRAQQGSQQAQGEAQEVLLRDVLALAFPFDLVEEVAKGMSGADLLQRVRTSDMRDCGGILWESKRTKAWSDSWLPKLRDDVRAADAACAVIVTQTLPQDIRHFGLRGGVWVCGWPYAAALAAVLRAAIVDASQARRAAEGRGEKTQMLYDYLTGTEFRHRVGGFVEALIEMQSELERERRAMMTTWKRRERLMDRALSNVAAFYGDLQGIAGQGLEDLPSLALDPTRSLPLPSDDDEDQTGPRRVRGGHAA
jgi:hypothetical protein